MYSELANQAEQQLIDAARRMSREERLLAFIEHSRRVHEFHAAGLRLRGAAPNPSDTGHTP